MINILAINGSPRINGNNRKLLEGLTSNLEDILKSNKKIYSIKKFNISELNIKGCTDCRYCSKIKDCIIKDDMNKFYNLFNESDIIIITSPIYFYSISSQLKSMLDRLQCIWSSKFILEDSIIDREKNRVGVFISTAGVDIKKESDLFKHTEKTIDFLFKSINTKTINPIYIDNIDRNPINTIEIAKDITKSSSEKLICLHKKNRAI